MLGWLRLAAAGGLPAEALDEGLVAGVLGEHHLDRHRPVEEQVPGQVDVGHPALGELAVQLVAVVEDGRARRRGVGHSAAHTSERASEPARACRPRRSAAVLDLQHLLHDRLGDRGGDPATRGLAAAGLVEHDHRDGHAGRLPGGPAKPMIQAWLRGGSVPSWAVPVLPPDLVAGDLQPGGGAALRPRRSCPGAGRRPCLRRQRRAATARVVVLSMISSPCESRTSVMRWGFMIVPPLATPAATSAICSGVACTSFWPIEAWASLGGLLATSVGNTDSAGVGQVDRGGGVEAPRPGPGHHVGRADGGLAHLGEGRVARHRRGCRGSAPPHALAAEVADGQVGLGRQVAGGGRVDRARCR